MISFVQHDIGFDNAASFLIGRSHDTAFRHGWMREQAGFDFRSGDVVSGRNDHVVIAGLIPEIAVRIHDIGIAGDVPAVLDIFGLARVGQIFAAERPANGKSSRRAGRAFLPIVIDDTRFITGDGFTSRSGSDVVFRRRDEDMQHFRRADAVGQRKPGRTLPRFESRERQGFTS